MNSKLKKVIPTIVLGVIFVALVIVGYFNLHSKSGKVFYGIQKNSVVKVTDKGNPESILTDETIRRATKVGDYFVYSNEKGINKASIKDTSKKSLLRSGTPPETPLIPITDKTFVYYSSSKIETENKETQDKEDVADVPLEGAKSYEQNNINISSLSSDEEPMTLKNDAGEAYSVISLNANVNTGKFVFATEDEDVYLYDSSANKVTDLKTKANQVGFVDDETVWVSVSTDLTEAGYLSTIDLTDKAFKVNKVKERIFDNVTVLSVTKVKDKLFIIGNRNDETGTIQLLLSTDLKLENHKLMLNFTKLGLNSNKTVLPYGKDTAFLDFRSIGNTFDLTFELNLDSEVQKYYEGLTDIFN